MSVPGYGDGPAWRRGPHPVYRRFAAAALDTLALPLAGLSAVDAGAGTGSLAEELATRGARVVCADRSLTMVRQAPAPRVVCDVTALPLRDGCMDLATAGFVLSHVESPGAALRVLAGVTRPGGLVVATGFRAGGAHPVKAAVDEVLTRAGYRPPEWYVRLKHTGEARVGDPAALATLAAEAGLADVRVLECAPSLTGLDADTVAAWRLGMAHVAPFVASLPPAARDRLTARVTGAISAVALAEPVQVLVLRGAARVIGH